VAEALHLVGDARSGRDRGGLDAVLALRPTAPLTRLEDLGHYPQIEDPARVAEALQGRLAA
jgi:pimeloyl-ACP methyl ester carboxylesterase